MNHTFVFEPITLKFGKVTNLWMLFQILINVFN